MPMRLHWSPRSPFVRKVMVAAHELGLAERIERQRSVVAMAAPNAAVMADNPLGKIPTLLLEDGTVLYDSLVICEYLDGLAGGPTLFPPAGPARWTELRRHALANGLLDVLILWRHERERGTPTPALLDAFALKTHRVLDALEGEVAEVAAAPLGIGAITIGVLGGYLDFRFADLGWREGRPALAAWHAEFAERPSMRATAVVDA
jgi:glutathione S-transferase